MTAARGKFPRLRQRRLCVRKTGCRRPFSGVPPAFLRSAAGLSLGIWEDRVNVTDRVLGTPLWLAETTAERWFHARGRWDRSPGRVPGRGTWTATCARGGPSAVRCTEDHACGGRAFGAPRGALVSVLSRKLTPDCLLLLAAHPAAKCPRLTWKKLPFTRARTQRLNEEKKMSFDLFILTVPFFLRAPQIFSSGNCFTCLNRPACSPARIESNGIVFETAMQSPSRDICGTPVPDRGGSQRECSVSQDAGRDQEAQTTVTFTTCPPGAGRRRRGFRPL